MPPVILMMLDGMRPDALTKANAPRLHRFMEEGAYTLTARSVMPSVTLPCHTSIFHSVPPTRHGILENQWHTMSRPVTGLIEAAHAAEKRCGFFHNWEPLRDLNRPEKLQVSFYANTSYELDGDRVVAEAAVKYIPHFKLDFAFVYFGVIDIAGHVFGWMSDDYIKQIERTDEFVGMVLDAVGPEATVIIHADHGGHDRDHGTEMPEDMTIPWLIGGAGVKKGYMIERPVSLLDTAPTIAHLMGIPQPRDWEGTAVIEALESSS